MKNKIFTLTIMLAFATLFLNASDRPEKLEHHLQAINAAQNFDELAVAYQNALIEYPTENDPGYLAVAKAYTKKSLELEKETTEEIITDVKKSPENLEGLFELRKQHDFLPEIAEVAFKEKAKKILNNTAHKLNASHGKILGGNTGKVWGAIIAFKQKLPGANMPYDVISNIASYLFTTPDYTPLEKLNIALELAADPHFKNAEKYFKAEAQKILESESFFNPYIEKPEIDIDIVKELGYKPLE